MPGGFLLRENEKYSFHIMSLLLEHVQDLVTFFFILLLIIATSCQDPIESLHLSLLWIARFLLMIDGITAVRTLF